MKLQPVDDKIVVKPFDTKEQTKSGIIIPASQDEPKKGEVVAVSDGVLDMNGKRIPSVYEVGHTVIYNQHAGVDVKVDGETLKVLKEHDILVIVFDE